MHNRNHFKRLLGLAAAGVAVPGHAAAQDLPAPPVVAPTPAPSRSPSVIYLPGTAPGGFNIGPRATPTPAATPAASRTPEARATPRPVVTPATVARRAPEPSASPSAPTRVETAPAPEPSDLAMPRPAPAASPVLMPVPATAVPADESLPGWLWALIGAGATALAIGAVWALRRSRVIAEDAAEEPYEPVAPPPAPPRPAPVAPTPPRAPTPAPASIPPAPASRASEPFEIALQPAGITLSEREVVLEFELLVGNLQDITAENVRPQLGLMSAHPDQDREIGAFHANSVLGASNQPFDLPARGGGRMPVRLALARDRVHVVQVGGRPMFVPIVMLDLRWRSGISIRRFGADFMVGTAGQGGKVGPIWLDRPSVTGPLAATRYRLRQVAAA